MSRDRAEFMSHIRKVGQCWYTAAVLQTGRKDEHGVSFNLSQIFHKIMLPQEYQKGSRKELKRHPNTRTLLLDQLELSSSIKSNTRRSQF